MLQVDVLSGFLICGVGSLIAAAMLRLARADDALQRQALRTCGGAFVVLGLALVPAGLGPAVAGHAGAQWSLAAGSLVALAILARGLSQLQGQVLAWRWVVAAGLTGSTLCAALVLRDRWLFGQVYALLLFLFSLLALWGTRRFVRAPRDLAERLVGATIALLSVSTAIRVGATALSSGPARIDLMYGPQGLVSVFAVLYAVLPMLVAALLLNLLNARLQLQLRLRAQTDELTGVLTRRALYERAPELLQSAASGRGELAVMMLDIDHFKQINDSHGHAAGDSVLREVAAVLRSQMRPDGLLARYGGEEFVALLPVDDASSARRVAERMRGAIEGSNWRRGTAVDSAVTVSIGVAMLGMQESLEAALQRADEALYRAKHAGRNQCQMSLRVA